MAEGNVGGARLGQKGINLAGVNGGDGQESGNPLQNMSMKELMEKLTALLGAQQQGKQAEGAGGGKGGGGPEAANGAGGAKGGGEGQFSLEELLKEMQRRAQEDQKRKTNEVGSALKQNPGIFAALQGGAPVGEIGGGMPGGGMQLGGGGGGAFA